VAESLFLRRSARKLEVGLNLVGDKCLFAAFTPES
jgi:hypothetical protein